MSSLGAAIGQFLYAVEHHRNLSELQQSMAAVHPLIMGATVAELNDQLRRFPNLIRDTHIVSVGALAMTSGAMVENRGDPLICGNALLARLPEMLHGLIAFYTEIRQLASESQGEPNLVALAEQHASKILEQNPPAAWGYIAEQSMSLGTVSHLAKSKDLRGIAHGRAELVSLSCQSDALKGQGSSFLTSMLEVLDDERLLVLHPGEHKGFEVVISGIADNYQLHTLLADAVIHNPAEGGIDGTRPSADAVQLYSNQSLASTTRTVAEACFTMWNWQGMNANGKLPTVEELPLSTEKLIANPSNPRSIPLFKGHRVVVLGPVLYPNSWRAGRLIPVMDGDLTVQRRLSSDEVTSWLNRITTARGKGEGVT